MGQHFISPVAAGIRQRDDYGAVAGLITSPACQSVSPLKKNYRMMRSFPVVQPRMVDAMGRLNHVA